MKTHKVLLTVLMPALVLTSPVPQDKLEDEDVDLPDSGTSDGAARVPNLGKAIGKSATDLFDILVKGAPSSDNLILSPLSIYMAMSLVYHGAGGNSRNQLGSFLGVDVTTDNLIQDEVHSLLTSYSSLKSLHQTQIALANALFSDKTFTLKAQYQERIRQTFLSTIRAVNFANSRESAGVINRWVANKTNNLITDLVDSSMVDRDTRLMLLNAVYFKANWQRKFLVQHTRKKPFYLNRAKTTEVEVDMMNRAAEFLVGHDDQLQADVLSLQYEDPNFTMLLLLPDDDQSVDNLCSRIKDRDFNAVHNGLKPSFTLVQLPKFNLEHKTRLVSSFKQLGVEDIFNENKADLSEISTEGNLFVSDIIHQATVEVNEEGSEAAAVTGIAISTRVGFSSQSSFIVDRPFLFVIQDLRNNIPLFMGKVVNPTNQQPKVQEKEEEFSLLTEDFEYDELDYEPAETLIGVRSGSTTCLGEDNPCQNGGICAVSALDDDDYVCACLSDFSGRDCEFGTVHQDEDSELVNEADDETAIIEFEEVEESNVRREEEQLGVRVFSGDNCVPGTNYTDVEGEEESDNVRFPCPHTEDTEPIKEYIEKHGDPSLLGVRGELATPAPGSSLGSTA